MENKKIQENFFNLTAIKERDWGKLTNTDFKNGMVLIYGSGLKMSKFYKEKNSEIESKNLIIKKFLIASGSIPNINTALPVDSRKAISAAFKALALARYDSKRVRFILFILKFHNPLIFWLYPIIFRKQFCLLIKNDAENFFSFISNNLEVSKEQGSFSIYKAVGKFILPIFDNKSGKVLGYAKIYNKKAKERSRNEASALIFLKKFQFKNAETPKLIASGYLNEYFINLISTKIGLKNSKREAMLHFEWIEELAEKTGKNIKFKDSLFAKEMEKEIKFIKKKLDKNSFNLIMSFYEDSLGQLIEKNFLFSFINREFDYHEFLYCERKGFVIDWEYARLFFPPIFDVYNLVLSKNVNILKENSYSKIHIKNFNSVFFNGNKKSEKAVNYFLRRWLISREDAYSFFILFLIDKIYSFIFSESREDEKVVLEFLHEIKNNGLEYKRRWIKNAIVL